jgi:hypothetical protein
MGYSRDDALIARNIFSLFEAKPSVLRYSVSITCEEGHVTNGME